MAAGTSASSDTGSAGSSPTPGATELREQLPWQPARLHDPVAFVALDAFPLTPAADRSTGAANGTAGELRRGRYAPDHRRRVRWSRSGNGCSNSDGSASTTTSSRSAAIPCWPPDSSSITRDLGVEVRSRMVFETPTIASFAAAVFDRLRADPVDTTPVAALVAVPPRERRAFLFPGRPSGGRIDVLPASFSREAPVVPGPPRVRPAPHTTCRWRYPAARPSRRWGAGARRWPSSE